MGNIVLGAIMPHPPILVPEIGRERLKEAEQSKQGMEETARRIKESSPDVIIVVTPHGAVGQASIPVYTGHVFEGNFSAFGRAKPLYSFKGDTDFALAIIKDCNFAASCSETLLDHGALVPLHYIQAAGIKTLILPIAVAFKPLSTLFEFGRSLAKTAERLGRRVALIASADMSHCLTADAPGGFNPRGKEFDEKLVELIKNYDVRGILSFDPALADAAAQDALWSIAILLGTLDGLRVKHEVLSYEGPFGVGYMTAIFQLQTSNLKIQN
jgi:AmmeMemoRadiSam system protein B